MKILVMQKILPLRTTIREMYKTTLLFFLMLLALGSCNQPKSWLLPIPFFGKDSVMIGEKISNQPIYSKLKIHSTWFIQSETWASTPLSSLFNGEYEYFCNKDSVLKMVLIHYQSDLTLDVTQSDIIKAQEAAEKSFEYCRNMYGDKYLICDRLSETNTSSFSKYVSIIWNIKDCGSVIIELSPLSVMTEEYQKNFKKMFISTEVSFISDTISVGEDYRLSRYWTLQRLGFK